MYKRCVGIEIGTRQVKIVWRKENNLYGEVAEPLPDDSVCDGKIVSMEAMAEFLKAMAQKYHMEESWCCLVLPDSVAYTKRLKMPAMTIEHLKLNLPYEFFDFLQNKGEPYVFDYAVIRMDYRPNKKPLSMDLMAVAASKNVIEEYRQMLRMAGWKMKIAAPAAFAYSNMIRDYEKGQPLVSSGDYCFVDLGYHTTKILFFHGSGLEASRELDIGCQQLIQAVENEKNVDFHVAETYIKENYQNICESRACYQVYEAVGIDIRRTLEFYYFRNPDRRFTKLYFCGGGSRIEKFCSIVSEYAGLKPDFAGKFISGGGLEEEKFSDMILCPQAVGITIFEEKPSPGIWNHLKEQTSRYFQRRQRKAEEV